jgi:hypothetical protein
LSALHELVEALADDGQFVRALDFQLDPQVGVAARQYRHRRAQHAQGTGQPADDDDQYAGRCGCAQQRDDQGIDHQLARRGGGHAFRKAQLNAPRRDVRVDL